MMFYLEAIRIGMRAVKVTRPREGMMMMDPPVWELMVPSRPIGMR